MVVGLGCELFRMKRQRNYRHQSKKNRVEKRSELLKSGHKSHILFYEMPILCWNPSLWCPSTHLWRTKLTSSQQPCTDWFQLFLWEFYMRTATGWNHPAQILWSLVTHWPTLLHTAFLGWFSFDLFQSQAPLNCICLATKLSCMPIINIQALRHGLATAKERTLF